VFGLVDADRDNQPTADHVIEWPVAMIENLLLEPEAIYAALRPFGSQTAATSPAVVSDVLRALVSSRVEEEVQLRVRRSLPVGRLVLDLGLQQSAAEQASGQAEKWATRLEGLDIPGLTASARTQVESVLEGGSGLERFHGKRLLRAAFDRLGVRGAGLSHSAFALAVAAHAAGTERTTRLTAQAVDRIKLYFPPRVPEALSELGEGGPSSLSERCAAERESWEVGSPEAGGREEIRRALFNVAMQADDPARQNIVSLASEIGTP